MLQSKETGKASLPKSLKGSSEIEERLQRDTVSIIILKGMIGHNWTL